MCSFSFSCPSETLFIRSRRFHQAPNKLQTKLLFQIYNWLDSLVAIYPDVVTPLSLGRSYEGREIQGVKISFKEGNRAVIFEGGEIYSHKI